ncbi:GntR family transcriptional regulator [Clostridium sp. UBA4548]|uniref:GntR family transcriptional regulator n=1 Tax=Clostridium sp. UBA4548 TaxID=1946361 RepID=UPI0025B7FE20|nr:GntR family transcriptional regulator [Clostridium sp. UBA4548]
MEEKYKNHFRDEAIEKIEYYIIKNKIRPHEKIPSERDLCEMWGFNRTTLRFAIQRLVIEGKLYQKKGSGTYVSEPKVIRNLQNLSSLSEEVRSNNKTLTSKILDYRVIESNKETTKKLHLTLGSKIFVLTRLRYIDEEPVTIETSFMDYGRFSMLTNHDFSKESLYSVIEEEGVKLIKGEESIGITYATNYEAELLNIEPGKAMFYVSGTVYDGENHPVEYFKSIVTSDKIKFSSVLT